MKNVVYKVAIAILVLINIGLIVYWKVQHDAYVKTLEMYDKEHFLYKKLLDSCEKK